MAVQHGFVSDLVRNPEDRVSHDAAHFSDREMSLQDTMIEVEGAEMGDIEFLINDNLTTRSQVSYSPGGWGGLDYDIGAGVRLELFKPTLFMYTGFLKSTPNHV